MIDYHGLDYVCFILSILGFYLIGLKKWYGWLVSIIANIFWFYIGYKAQSFGMILNTTAFTILFGINLAKWKSEEITK